MHKEVFNACLLPYKLDINYSNVNIKGARRNAATVTGMFQAELTANGDRGYVHIVPGKVFSIGIMIGCPRSLGVSNRQPVYCLDGV